MLGIGFPHDDVSFEHFIVWPWPDWQGQLQTLLKRDVVRSNNVDFTNKILALSKQTNT